MRQWWRLLFPELFPELLTFCSLFNKCAEGKIVFYRTLVVIKLKNQSLDTLPARCWGSVLYSGESGPCGRFCRCDGIHTALCSSSYDTSSREESFSVMAFQCQGLALFRWLLRILEGRHYWRKYQYGLATNKMRWNTRPFYKSCLLILCQIHMLEV